MAGVKTIGKWVVPATVVTMAVAAILFLGVLELAQESSAKPAANAGLAAAPAAAPTRRRGKGASSRSREVAPPPRARAKARRGADSSRQQAALVPSATAADLSGGQEGAPDSLLARLGQAADLGARLRLLDAHLGQIQAQRAPDELEALLEGALPGRFAEAEQLRLGVLARLGRYDDPRVEAALVRRLDAEIPRPQRLLALELLASRPHVGRISIGALASGDLDLVVRKKAAWALQHSP